ncbi:hypothetical protein Tco_0863442, partial [Tanacetum coccineum]
MDLLSFIRNADPTKVRVGERQRAEGEPKLFDTTVGGIVSLLLVSPARASSELEACVEKLFYEGGSGSHTERGDSVSGGHGVDIPQVNKARGAQIHWGSHTLERAYKVTPSDIQHSAATQIWGCYILVSEPGYREPVKIVMSSASSAVTYTSVYTDSEPGRVFWGADDEEITDGGIPRTPPVPQDEDEHKPMFIQPHDPDYVPEPIYPEYIPLEEEHVFPVEEQPLPPVDSPTTESLGYVVESDPEEDLDEYKDEETEDGPGDYPIDGGDDGDDDDGDSSGDDADDEDEEEEEHLASADSAVVIPTVELVSPSEGAEPVIPPPSIDITTTRARITARLQASISLPPEAEVERLLAMTTPSPSP